MKNSLPRAVGLKARKLSSDSARSFDREALLPEVLTLAYGPKLAAFLMMIGLVFIRAGEFTRDAADGGLSWKDNDFDSGLSWKDNAAAFGEFTEHVLALQEMYKEVDKRFPVKQHTPAGPDSRPATSSGRWTQAPRSSATGEFKLKKARIARRKAQKP